MVALLSSSKHHIERVHPFTALFVFLSGKALLVRLRNGQQYDLQWRDLDVHLDVLGQLRRIWGLATYFEWTLKSGVSALRSAMGSPSPSEARVAHNRARSGERLGSQEWDLKVSTFNKRVTDFLESSRPTSPSKGFRSTMPDSSSWSHEVRQRSRRFSASSREATASLNRQSGNWLDADDLSQVPNPPPDPTNFGTPLDPLFRPHIEITPSASYSTTVVPPFALANDVSDGCMSDAYVNPGMDRFAADDYFALMLSEITDESLTWANLSLEFPE